MLAIAPLPERPAQNAAACAAPARKRVLLAPVTVTPTKPLTPSHLKGLLWADVMYKATRQLADVTYRYSHTTYHPTEQTLGFWEHLDRTLGDADYSALDEEQIGELYVGYRAAQRRPTAAELRPYADAVERGGWVHPSSARVLRLWAGHYEGLGMYDPGLTEHSPPGLGLEEMVNQLDELGLCLDQRALGGPVYADLTRHGLPLRQIIAPDGRPNYLACALRELLPLAPSYDEIVLLYDRELDPDYQLLERALSEMGPSVCRVPIGRVPIGGEIRSARHGGFRGYGAGDLIALARERHGGPALRLGMRLYFIATLGAGQRQSFRHDLLLQSLARAERLLEAAGQGPPSTPPADLPRHRDRAHVDPYRLTSGLLGRRGTSPALLAEVFL